MKEIKIYDYIGFGGVIAQDVIEQIGEEKDVSLRLNSPGGVVAEAIAIYNYLKNSGKNIHVYVDGYAASAASVIMMAGITVTVYPSSIIMLHKPSNIAFGNADEMRKTADVLDIHEDAILEIYMSKATATRDEIRAMIQDETWLLGADAVAVGLADELKEDEEQETQSIAAMFSFAAVNKKMMEAKMSRQETRKEITAERDALTEKVIALEASIGEISARLEAQQAEVITAKAERDAAKAEAEKAKADFSAAQEAFQATTLDLSKRIEAITDGLKNPAFADAAMIAAWIKSESGISDAEIDAAEQAASAQSASEKPKSLREQFEAMPHGKERSDFWNKNKKQIFSEMEKEEEKKI